MLSQNLEKRLPFKDLNFEIFVQSGVKWVTSMDDNPQWSLDTELIDESFGWITCTCKGSDTDTELKEKGYSEKFHFTFVLIVSVPFTLTLHWYSSSGELLPKVFSKKIFNETKSKVDFPEETLSRLSVPKRLEESSTLRTSRAESI
jgi:hypothetical protein